MKKFWIVISGLIMISLLGGLIFFVRQTEVLQDEVIQIYEENKQLNEQNLQQASEAHQLQSQNSDLEDKIEQLEISTDILEEEIAQLKIASDTLNCIEDCVAELISKRLSAYDMEVLDVWSIGQDSPENVQRLYVCIGRYYYEFYVADYLTGEIKSLNRNIPGVFQEYMKDEETQKIVVAPLEYEISIKDFNQDNTEDILLVTSFDTQNHDDYAIYLWLQIDGEFHPVNRLCCGYYADMDNSFSEQVEALEKRFTDEQNPEAWSIEAVSAWVKGELIGEKQDELLELLQNPIESIPYNERRVQEDINIEVPEDEKGYFSVLIDKNPYSEQRINDWLEAFYEKDEAEKNSFYASFDEEYADVFENVQEQRYYETCTQCIRVDDAVISFVGNTYIYSGGAHGTDYSFSMNFDTKSGRLLSLENVVLDKNKFCDFAMEYITEKWGEEYYGWGMEDIRESLFSEHWCFTNKGMMIFLNGGNGLGTYEYELPYEDIADMLEVEYLPSVVTETTMGE